jgi:hypothetical protein
MNCASLSLLSSLIFRAVFLLGVVVGYLRIHQRDVLGYIVLLSRSRTPSDARTTASSRLARQHQPDLGHQRKMTYMLNRYSESDASHSRM